MSKSFVGIALSLCAACGPSSEANAPPSPTPASPTPVAAAPGDTSELVNEAPGDAMPTATASTAKGVIDAYFAAVEAGDREAAHALLTPEAREEAKTSRKSFTYAFFEMGFKVKTRRLRGEIEEQGDKASAYFKAVLLDEKGKDDNEGMRFVLVREDGKWLIAEIN